MEVIFYKNKSSENTLKKNIEVLETKDIFLKEKTDVVYPTLILNSVPLETNYIYIPDFERYYFIRKKHINNNNLMQLELETDFLMSFQNLILSSAGIISQSETLQNYASSYQVLDTVQTKVIPFTVNNFTENHLYLIGAN